MNIGILGSGGVARTIAGKLLGLDQHVMVSARDLTSAKTSAGQALSSTNDWVAERQRAGQAASAGTFQEAAEFGEIVFNCTAGSGTFAAVEAAGQASFAGKILVDLANPLDFSRGMPPTLTVCNETSLAEALQAALPEAKVVKALNTVNDQVMVNPALLPGDHDMFVAGNDQEAKVWVRETLLMDWFGWKIVHDLGDITAARGMEMYLPLWLRLWGTFGHGYFNLHLTQVQK